MPRLGKRIRWIGLVGTGLVLAGLGAVRFLGWRETLSDPLAHGFAAYDRRDWTTAADAARRRLSTDREDLRALRLLARSYVHLGRDQTATAQYRKLITRGSMALSAEDYYLLGMAMRHLRETDNAVAAWETGARLEPERPELLDELARAYTEQNRLVEAASAAERLAKYTPWKVRAGLILGELRSTLNDPAAAVESLEAALLDDRKLQTATSAPFLFRKLLARNSLRLGRPAPARSQLKTVLDAGLDTEASWLLSRAELQAGAAPQASSALRDAGSYRAQHPLEPEPSPYLGAERCATCHREIFRAVLSSRHAQSFYRGNQLRTILLPDHPLQDPGEPKVTHSIVRIGEQLRIETRTLERVYQCVIDYGFGTHDRYLTLVGRDDQGEYRAARLSYYRSTAGSGWDLSAGDTVKPDREHGFLGRPVEARHGAVRCLYCHTTNVRGGTVRMGPETGDPGIGCERCHGPGENHLKAIEGQFADMAISASTLHPTSRLTRLCNECHTLHSPEVEMEVPRTDPIWHRSPGVSFTWSRCVISTGEDFNCLTCHDPHRPAERLASYYEAKCLSCHQESLSPVGRGSQPEPLASNHAEAGAPTPSVCPVNPAGGCLGCHMPRVQNDVLHLPLTDHYIRVRTRATP